MCVVVLLFGVVFVFFLLWFVVVCVGWCVGFDVCDVVGCGWVVGWKCVFELFVDMMF